MKALVYATGPLGERVAGPEIRALQFAHALSKNYEVTLMAQRPQVRERDGFRVVPSSRWGLVREARRSDIVVSPCLPPYLLILKNALRFTAVSDKYDPYEVELVALDEERHDRELRVRSLQLSVDLRCADVVLCAGEQQRGNLMRIGGKLKQKGGLRVDPVVIPFAVPDPPAASSRRPLRERFPQIQATDTVVLWWGAVWKWLDVETPIRAVATMADTRPDVKLVITAGAPPNANNRRFDAVSEARQLATELGVIGRSVLFIDEWIAYDDRWDYLREADIGVTLHRYASEAELAARSRYTDYLSAALPCVLGRGDQLASEFETAGFATLVDDPDPKTLADLLVALVDDRRGRAAAAEAGRRLAVESSVRATGEKLRGTLAATPAKPTVWHRADLNLAQTVGKYYAYKLAHVLHN